MNRQLAASFIRKVRKKPAGVNRRASPFLVRMHPTECVFHSPGLEKGAVPTRILTGWKSRTPGCLRCRCVPPSSSVGVEVTSNGEPIANGFEGGEIEARFEGHNAMFLLLAAGWDS
jgi:hypothetical protein